MARCIRENKLEIHHKRRDGGNGEDNAQALCQSCHENTDSYGKPGQSPPEFDTATKGYTLLHANNQCECVKDNCH